MGRKIFVSYKYADHSVQNLPYWGDSTARDYVTEFEKILDASDHIYKGESDREDLSKLSEETIWHKLRDRIYDSSITIIFISPGMKDGNKKEKDQWIPWEISYSLKETSRKNKNGASVKSKTNAMLAVVLPDLSGSYAYCLEESPCYPDCFTYHTENLFQIIRENTANLKNMHTEVCDDGSTLCYGDFSYIGFVKWVDFKKDYNKYIAQAYDRQSHIDDYNIKKEL